MAPTPNTLMATGEEEQQKHQQSVPVPTTVFLPFPPLHQHLNIAAHETLLRRLGLWDFLNLDMSKTIREDLINELVVNYEYYPNKLTGASRVKDASISLDRMAVAKALHLPVERAPRGGSFPVSKDESAFLEKLIWGHLVLRDASVAFDGSYILQFFEGLKELQLAKSDWAGLVWLMMETELLRGKREKLVKCYYASHLQLVLKHQRPELFDDHHGAKLLLSLQNEAPQLDTGLDLCAQESKLWTGRLVNSARRRVEETQVSNLMLQKKFEEQKKIIQQYQLRLHKVRQETEQKKQKLQMERQQKQKSDGKYERDLDLVKSTLEGYRKLIKETNDRARAQLPEEPLYMPHPDGGGDVILVSEWKKLEEERQKMAIKAALEEFEQVWMGKMEEQLGFFDVYSARLQGLEDEVRKIRGGS